MTEFFTPPLRQPDDPGAAHPRRTACGDIPATALLCLSMLAGAATGLVVVLFLTVPGVCS